jgi:hypothetical protein
MVAGDKFFAVGGIASYNFACHKFCMDTITGAVIAHPIPTT